MDITDLEELKAAVDRALVKEKEIRSLFGDKVEILQM